MSLDKYTEKVVPAQAPRKREAPAAVPTPVRRRRGPVAPRAPLDIADVFKNRQTPQFDQNIGFHGGPSARRKGYRLAAWSWVASTVDTLVLISASCAFLLMFSMIVNIPIGRLLRVASFNQSQFLLFFEVLLVLGWTYLVSVRSLLGFTLGEWACDLRLGQPHERLKSGYAFKVALRSTLILVTGVLPLPVLSLLLGKDLAGSLTGLRLFSLK